ncbi:MAG: phosphatase PAP2 family protein [Chloroflexi bacterium]|nr:phosphatase PAP2 family protein [Chloroflexota bacterium]
MEALFNSGIAWIVAFQGLGDWLTAPMKLLSFLGSEDFFILILPVVYWCLDAGLGLRVGMILLFSGGVNNILKLSFHWPRPYWYSAQVAPLAAESSFGLPSGHAQIAAGVWGTVAGYYRRAWGWIAAVLVVLFIGLSRLYLGVHFPHDVLTGWLIGGLILWGFLRFWDPVAAWLKQMPFGRQVLVAFLVSATIILLGGLAFAGLGGWTMPAGWLTNAARAGDELPAPVSMNGLLTSAGALFGLAVGLAWMERRGGFSAAGPGWKRGLRYLVGVVGVAVLYLGLKVAFPSGENLPAYAFRYLRYTLVGAWISGGAPWLFIKLQLAYNPNP